MIEVMVFFQQLILQFKIIQHHFDECLMVLINHLLNGFIGNVALVVTFKNAVFLNVLLSFPNGLQLKPQGF